MVQTDQHSDARCPKAPVPAINFAERSGDERRGDDSAVDKDVVNLKRVRAAVVARRVKRANLAGEIAFKTADAAKQTVSARRNVTSNAIRKCPADISSAPMVIVRVRPSQRSAINPPAMGVR